MQEYHINCKGCKKPDKDTLIGKLEDCQWCDGTGNYSEDDNGNITTGIGNYCNICDGRGKKEYIPKTSHHHWARCDSYGIYTGIYCDDCYKNNYPYKKGRYFDESYCGERLESDY